MARGMGVDGQAEAAVDAADETAGPAEVLWLAAGEAMVWKSSILEHAADMQCRKAWAAKAKADRMLDRAVEECGRAVGEHGLMDMDAVWLAIDAMGRTARPLTVASKALTLASELCEEAGAELQRASDAFARSTNPAHAAPAANMSAHTRERAAAEAKRAAIVIDGTRSIIRNAGRLSAAVARSVGMGRDWAVDYKTMSSVLAGMREGARHSHMETKEMRRRMRKAEYTAVRMRRLAASMAGKAAEAATGVLALELDGQGVQGAEAAWCKAMAAATAADAEHPGDKAT